MVFTVTLRILESAEIAESTTVSLRLTFVSFHLRLTSAAEPIPNRRFENAYICDKEQQKKNLSFLREKLTFCQNLFCIKR